MTVLLCDGTCSASFCLSEDPWSYSPTIFRKSHLCNCQLPSDPVPKRRYVAPAAAVVAYLGCSALGDVLGALLISPRDEGYGLAVAQAAAAERGLWFVCKNSAVLLGTLPALLIMLQVGPHLGCNVRCVWRS